MIVGTRGVIRHTNRLPIRLLFQIRFYSFLQFLYLSSTHSFISDSGVGGRGDTAGRSI